MSAHPAEELLVHRQRHSLGAEQDLDRALQLLQGTQQDERHPGTPVTPPMLRMYRPVPTVAFGQRDARLPGFEAAAAAARDHGFEPLIRRAGGRAAAYHPGSLVIDHIEPDTNAIAASRDRFVRFGQLIRDALRSCGVDARLGPIPREYCVGEHSVHAVSPAEQDVRIKVVGTAQRVIRTGWLFSSAIIVEEGRTIRHVLTDVYSALGLTWDPLTAGALDMVSPGVTLDAVEAAVLQEYSRSRSLRDLP